MKHYSKITAIHEAGHVLGSWYAGQYIHGVSIRSGEIINRFGNLIKAKGLTESDFCIQPALFHWESHVYPAAYLQGYERAFQDDESDCEDDVSQPW